jgi:hypothetical protein
MEFFFYILCLVNFASSLVMVIYKNAVIQYFNILFKIVNTISCKITSDALLRLTATIIKS